MDNIIPAVIKMLLLESNILSAKDSEEKPPNWKIRETKNHAL